MTVKDNSTLWFPSIIICCDKKGNNNNNDNNSEICQMFTEGPPMSSHM